MAVFLVIKEVEELCYVKERHTKSTSTVVPHPIYIN